MVRVAPDFSATPIKEKASNAQHRHIHTMLVTGNEDREAGNFSVRLHRSDPQGAEPGAAVIANNPGASRNRMGEVQFSILQRLNADHGVSLKNFLSECAGMVARIWLPEIWGATGTGSQGAPDKDVLCSSR